MIEDFAALKFDKSDVFQVNEVRFYLKSRWVETEVHKYRLVRKKNVIFHFISSFKVLATQPRIFNETKARLTNY